jgi:hypothetical protein
MNRYLIAFLTIASLGIAIYFYIIKNKEKRELKLLVRDPETIKRIQAVSDTFNKQQIENYNKEQEKIDKSAKNAALFTGIGVGITSAVLTVVTGGAAAPFIPLIATAGSTASSIAQKEIYKKGKQIKPPIQISNI